MNRKEKREKKEKINVLNDLVSIIRQYFPELVNKFNGLTDLRNQSYVVYQMKVIFIVRLMGLMCEMKSMQGMTRDLNTEEAISNIAQICGLELEEIPHCDTINDVFEKVKVEEIEEMEVQVIEKIQGRIDRTTGLQINRKLKVAAYARVSTDSEDQLNSFESQVKYYNEKITKNIEWSFVEVYADESISGTQDYKRSNFMRMIQDSMNGKIDLILTKSISRFARNTLDTLKYVRMLKEKNVAILFEEENINTLEMAGELLLTILSSVAQQESETISSHVKLGLKMKQQRGELIGYNGCLGYTYDKENKSISINQEEAEIVKYIFNRYAQGVGSSIIARELTNMKYLTPKGLTRWSDSTVRRILKNEKYKGDVLQGKTYTTDPITHKRVINMGEENQYYIKEHHTAIIGARTI